MGSWSRSTDPDPGSLTSPGDEPTVVSVALEQAADHALDPAETADRSTRRRTVPAWLPVFGIAPILAVLIAAVVIAGPAGERGRVDGLQQQVSQVRKAVDTATVDQLALSNQVDELSLALDAETARADQAEELLAAEQARNAAAEQMLTDRLQPALAELDRLTAETERMAGQGELLALQADQIAAANRQLVEENEFLRSAVVVSRAAGDLRLVALTIDDGGSAEINAGVLDTLAAYDVNATLFPSGDNVAASPEVWARAVTEGHELGNHTMEHRSVKRLDADQLVEQIAAWEAAVAMALGEPYDAVWFRPPYMAGFEDLVGPDETREILAAEGYITALWDVETYYALYSPDGPQLGGPTPGSNSVVRHVVSAAGPGSIVLLHFAPLDVAALPGIIEGLRAKGLEPVTLSELFAAQQVLLDS